MKKLIILLIVFVLFVLLISDLFYFSLNRLDIKSKTIDSQLVPDELDGLSIVFFSDLHYTPSMNKSILDNVVDQINSLNPDLVLFGGDLLQKNSGETISEENKAILVEALARIQSTLGKYTVYGNHDKESEITLQTTTSLYSASGFTLLNNQAVQIHRKGNQYINLVGLDNEYNGTLDLNTAFSGIEANQTYTIVLEHTPDTIEKVVQFPAQLMLSGHSHGGQVRLPFLGALTHSDFGRKYDYGSYTVQSTLLEVNNGIGTTALPIRFLCNPTINHYILHKTI